MTRLRRLQDKREAKKLWREGVDIGLVPSNCLPYSMRTSPCWVNKNGYVERFTGVDYWQELWPDLDIVAAGWESMYNNWSYYNTCSEMGYYAHYYVREG